MRPLTKENERIESPVSGDPCAVSKKVSGERARITIKTPSTRRHIVKEKFNRWWGAQKKKESIWWWIWKAVSNVVGGYVILGLYVLGIVSSTGKGPDNPALFYKVLIVLGCFLFWTINIIGAALILFGLGYNLIAALAGLWNWITGKKKPDPDEGWRHAHKKKIKNTAKETTEEAHKGE